jgi:hypothetical protein
MRAPLGKGSAAWSCDWACAAAAQPGMDRWAGDSSAMVRNSMQGVGLQLSCTCTRCWAGLAVAVRTGLLAGGTVKSVWRTHCSAVAQHLQCVVLATHASQHDGCVCAATLCWRQMQAGIDMREIACMYGPMSPAVM